MCSQIFMSVSQKLGHCPYITPGMQLYLYSAHREIYRRYAQMSTPHSADGYFIMTNAGKPETFHASRSFFVCGRAGSSA